MLLGNSATPEPTRLLQCRIDHNQNAVIPSSADCRCGDIGSYAQLTEVNKSRGENLEELP
jgi:hypothetical protein